MDMSEWVQMWRDIYADNPPVKVGYHLYCHGEFDRLINAFGNAERVADYFAEVESTEPPEKNAEVAKGG